MSIDASNELWGRTWPEPVARQLAHVRAVPADMRSWLDLGEMFQRLREYRAANEAARQAHAVRRDEPGPLLRLARQLRFFYEIGLLRECVAMPAFAQGQSPEALAEMAVGLSVLGELGLAGRLNDLALAQRAGEPFLHYNRAAIREFAGDLDGAVADLRQALAAAPDDPHYLYALSRFPTRYSRPEDLADLDRALAHGEGEPDERALLHFARFKRLDRHAAREAAWQALVEGNRLMRDHLGYRLEPDLALMRALAAMPLPDAAPANDTDAPTPVFIVGLHRAGSSLLELQLSGDERVRSLGESFAFPAQLRWACNTAFAGACHAVVPERLAPADLARVAARYRRHLREREPAAAFVTEKLPMNFLNVGLILSALPEARVIHVRREPMDAAFSNFKEVFRNVANYSYDFVSLAGYMAGYRRLMAAWRARFGDRILDVDYEDLVAAPAATMARVRTHCGLGDAVTATAAEYGRIVPVATASSIQVRGGIEAGHVGAWRRYAPFLKPLRTALRAQGVEVADE